MAEIKRDSKGRIISNKTDTDTNDSKTKKGKNKAKSQRVFVGFYRNKGGELYALHPQALSSEESMLKKIEIMYGDVDTHIFATDLPL